MRRITIITGHYGSGKTEFAVNLAVTLAKEGKRTALADLDIANVYFRSRERQEYLEELGIEVHSNIFHRDISADLPAIAPSIRKVLENRDYHTVVDAGGNDTGAMVLIQYARVFVQEDYEVLCVINANRPETETLEGALFHIRSIEEMTGLKVSGLVNNTHMLAETEPKDVLKGYALCMAIEERSGIPFRLSCCTESTMRQFHEEHRGTDRIKPFPITLYMRPAWLDR